MSNDKKIIVRSGAELKSEKGYQSLVQELQDIMSKGLYQAYKAVDNIKVQTYWQVGERIVREELKHQDRAGYGDYLVSNLVKDLGMRERFLYEIIKFYQTYTILRTVSAELSWSHYTLLISIDDDQERGFYQNQAVLHSWSVRELRKQIKSNRYQHTSEKEIAETFKTRLPQVKAEQVFKDVYSFPFIEQPPQNEKELEERILENFEKVLKEFGEDFSILGRQIPIKIDGQTHAIDLVLYHRGIPCIILVDLKVGKLNSRDIGQMNKYIGYYRQNKEYEHEKETIGLVICKEAGKEEVRYALDGLEKKIFIAKYQVKLPSEEKIKDAIKDI
jgi:predicted nuclease of restriction endonuclease-like (RecB) superfamily